MGKTRANRARLVRSALASIIVAILAASAAADTTPNTPELRRAEESYVKGNFDEAILILKDYLERPGLAQSEQEAALRLLGLNYLAKDYRDQAKESVKKLLHLVPEYRANPEEDPPPYVAIVEESKAEIEAEREAARGGRGIRSWMYVGGALLAGATAALIAGGGGGGQEEPESGEPIGLPPALPW